MRACRVRGWQLRGSPSNLRERFVAFFGCRAGTIKLFTFLLVQEQCQIPAAILSWVLLAVTSSLPWRDKLSFRMVPCPSLQVRQVLRLPSPSLSPCSLLAEMLRRAEVLCGKNTVIRKGLQIGHNDCPNAGLDKLRAYMKGNRGFILATSCSLDDIFEGVGPQQALARSKSQTNLQCRFGVAFRTDWSGSIADQFLPVTWYWNEDGWSRRLRDCVRHRCSRGLSVGLHFLSHIFKSGHIPSCVRHRWVHVEPHQWCCLVAQQFSTLLPRTPNNRSTTSCFLTSVPRVMFPATLRSTGMKESWRLPTGEQDGQNHGGRRGGGHSFWTN